MTDHPTRYHVLDGQLQEVHHPGTEKDPEVFDPRFFYYENSCDTPLAALEAEKERALKHLEGAMETLARAERRYVNAIKLLQEAQSP